MAKTIVGLENNRLLDSNYIVDDTTILTEKLNGTVLFEGEEKETITLSKSVTDGTYNLIRVDYKTNDGYLYSKLIPVGTVSFNSSLVGDTINTNGEVYLKLKNISINDKTISVRSGRYNEIYFGSSGAVSFNNSDNIYFTKVVAYK